MKEAPADSRQTVVKSLLSGGVCEKMLSYKHDHVSKDKMTSSCMHLFGKIRMKKQWFRIFSDSR